MTKENDEGRYLNERDKEIEIEREREEGEEKKGVRRRGRR